MLSSSYYASEISQFCGTSTNEVLGTLAGIHGLDLKPAQRNAWQKQIEILQHALLDIPGWIFFEFSIPRMGKRADAVAISNGIIFVIEFKVGADNFGQAAIEQVHDYALDLKNFHKASHQLLIVPILVATEAAKTSGQTIRLATDGVAAPLCISATQIKELVEMVSSQLSASPCDPEIWARSGYQPTPTIVEAAQALYRNHSVKEISRSEGGENLGKTTQCIDEIIDRAKQENRKVICFVTGVPGAGKTLAGLNIATTRAHAHNEEHAVFLSGNGPLVEVLREALARNKVEQKECSKKDAHRQVASFVQNIHHFRDQGLRDHNPPTEKVVVFDEAQRAWGKEQTAKFMQQKRGYSEFNVSEPSFLISVMDRHPDWCAVVCLVGGGQEINTGEAGLSEWLKVLAERFPQWHVHISDRFSDPHYIWDSETRDALHQISTVTNEALHLSVSMRSFRAEKLSDFASHLVENRPHQALSDYQSIAERYPVMLTRDLEIAREWLRSNARGSERYGLVASSGAHRLRPLGLCVKAKVDPSTWFLNDRFDVRSAFYLEEVATEFDVQGLELDWVGLCWDADFRYKNQAWEYHNFRGTRWERVNAVERQLYLKNAYRVLMTRARQGMIIFVPEGSSEDPTRPPTFYDETYAYLLACGLKPIPQQNAS